MGANLARPLKKKLNPKLRKRKDAHEPAPACKPLRSSPVALQLGTIWKQVKVEKVGFRSGA